jgi:hypothetical protein
MIFGIKRSVLLALTLLTLLIGATFGVVIGNAIRAARSEGPVVSTVSTDANDSLVENSATPSTGSLETPTITPIADGSPTASPSETPVTQTPTSISPVASATTELTNTPQPSPTLTPTTDVDVCTLIDLDFIKSTSTIALWRLQNNSSTIARINKIEMEWPIENDAVFNSILNGKVIWVGEDLFSPTLMDSWYGEPADRDVIGTNALEFFFGTPASSNGYNLQISFDNGCTIASSN